MRIDVLHIYTMPKPPTPHLPNNPFGWQAKQVDAVCIARSHTAIVRGDDQHGFREVGEALADGALGLQAQGLVGGALPEMHPVYRAEGLTGGMAEGVTHVLVHRHALAELGVCCH